jgi:hypothetical protein
VPQGSVIQWAHSQATLYFDRQLIGTDTLGAATIRSIGVWWLMGSL